MAILDYPKLAFLLVMFTRNVFCQKPVNPTDAVCTYNLTCDCEIFYGKKNDTFCNEIIATEVQVQYPPYIVWEQGDKKEPLYLLLLVGLGPNDTTCGSAGLEFLWIASATWNNKSRQLDPRTPSLLEYISPVPEVKTEIHRYRLYMYPVDLKILRDRSEEIDLLKEDRRGRSLKEVLEKLFNIQTYNRPYLRYQFRSRWKPDPQPPNYDHEVWELPEVILAPTANAKRKYSLPLETVMLMCIAALVNR